MAFVCTITAESYHADVFRNGNAYSAIVNIGCDNEEPKSYSVVVGLEPNPAGQMELFFVVVEAFADGTEYEHWSGLQTRFLSRQERVLVMEIIADATKSLIERAKPDCILVVTHDDNPPEKALIKHRMIVSIVAHSGYRVTQSDQYHGKMVWIAERLATEKVTQPGT
jgi:hypothetical protein